MNINRVVLAGLFSFPYGDAPGSRIKNLALGFKDYLEDVQIISTFYDNNTNEFTAHGVEDVMGVGISYHSILPLSTINATSKVKDRILNRLKLLKLNRQVADKITENLRGDSNELLFLYGRSYLFLNRVLKNIAEKGYLTKVAFDVVEPPRIESSKLEYLFHPFVIDSTLAFNYLLPRFDLCTYISYKLSEVYGEGVKNKIIIPSVMHLKEDSIAELQSTTQIRMGYLGSLFEKDYPDLMYRLCLQLWENNTDFTFSIVGRFKNYADGRKWETRFLESPFREQVHFHFNPNEADKWEIISALDFMVCFRSPTLLQEYTFPTRVPELLVLGKVLVVNGFGDFMRYFEGGVNAIVVEDTDIESSAKSFEAYLIPENYKKMGVNANQLLHTTFNSSHAARRILEVFE